MLPCGLGSWLQLTKSDCFLANSAACLGLWKHPRDRQGPSEVIVFSWAVASREGRLPRLRGRERGGPGGVGMGVDGVGMGGSGVGLEAGGGEEGGWDGGWEVQGG